MASMLRPEVIRDLKLKDHGLRMVPCDPLVQVPFLDGDIVSWWSDPQKLDAELRRHSPRDADTFRRVDAQLKRLARYLQPFFLEPPPDVHARGVASIGELFRIGGRFRGITGDEIGEMVAFLTGSPRRLPRPPLRVGEGQDAGARQQRLRQARRPVPAGHGARPALPPALRRRPRGTGLHGPRHRRHGLDHAGDGGGLPAAGGRDPHRRTGGAHRGEGRRAPAAWRSRTATSSRRRSCSRTPTRSEPSSAWSRRPSSATSSAPPSRASRWRAPAPR